MQTDSVQNQIQQLEQTERATRRFRLLVVIAIIAIALASTSSVIESLHSLVSPGKKQDAYVKQLGLQLERELVPSVQKIASESLNRLQPKVNAEVAHFNNRAPEIAGVALHELDVLGAELPVRAEKVLDQTFGATLKAREDKLRKLNPKYDANVAKLVDNLDAEAREQIAQTSEKIFNPHLNSISHILTSLDTIHKTEPLDGLHEASSTQVAYLFTDVFVSEFRDFAVNPATAPKTPVTLTKSEKK